jgi:hypothetical protein
MMLSNIYEQANTKALNIHVYLIFLYGWLAPEQIRWLGAPEGGSMSLRCERVYN